MAGFMANSRSDFLFLFFLSVIYPHVFQNHMTFLCLTRLESVIFTFNASFISIMKANGERCCHCAKHLL